jgi:hypothetical protein
MLEMVKRLGFSLRRDTEGGTYRVEMALQGPGQQPACATQVDAG